MVVLIDLEWSIMIDERVWQPFFENVPDNVSFIFKWHPNAVLSTYEKARDAIQKISPETRCSIRIMHTIFWPLPTIA